VSPELVLEVCQGALKMATLIAALPLLSALVVGVLVGMVQAATQINEMTLSFIPKLLVLVLALTLGGPWMLSEIVAYTRLLISSIPEMIG
jgi:flagellar biosynthesis protein FliQ